MMAVAATIRMSSFYRTISVIITLCIGCQSLSPRLGLPRRQGPVQGPATSIKISQYKLLRQHANIPDDFTTSFLAKPEWGKPADPALNLVVASKFIVDQSTQPFEAKIGDTRIYAGDRLGIAFRPERGLLERKYLIWAIYESMGDRCDDGDWSPGYFGIRMGSEHLGLLIYGPPSRIGGETSNSSSTLLIDEKGAVLDAAGNPIPAAEISGVLDASGHVSNSTLSPPNLFDVSISHTWGQHNVPPEDYFFPIISLSVIGAPHKLGDRIENPEGCAWDKTQINLVPTNRESRPYLEWLYGFKLLEEMIGLPFKEPPFRDVDIELDYVYPPPMQPPQLLVGVLSLSLADPDGGGLPAGLDAHVA